MALRVAHGYVPGECLGHRDPAASVSGDAKARHESDGPMPERLPIQWAGLVAVPFATP
jgi:hypothetical protein